ncbi:hypothetical protein D1007_41183 [Hordeum vulgare]|nr:hypothetical protein D1007_41183 [Hordeum vulgare]
MDFSYLQDKVNGAESSSVVVAVMKTEIEKKEAKKMELQGKYSVLMNLVEAQGRVIRNQKAIHLKEKEKLSGGCDLAGGGYDLASVLDLVVAVPVALEPTVAACYSGHS